MSVPSYCPALSCLAILSLPLLSHPFFSELYLHEFFCFHYGAGLSGKAEEISFPGVAHFIIPRRPGDCEADRLPGLQQVVVAGWLMRILASCVEGSHNLLPSALKYPTCLLQ